MQIESNRGHYTRVAAAEQCTFPDKLTAILRTSCLLTCSHDMQSCRQGNQSVSQSVTVSITKQAGQADVILAGRFAHEPSQ